MIPDVSLVGARNRLAYAPSERSSPSAKGDELQIEIRRDASRRAAHQRP
jgi:hypothetical protein